MSELDRIYLRVCPDKEISVQIRGLSSSPADPDPPAQSSQPTTIPGCGLCSWRPELVNLAGKAFCPLGLRMGLTSSSTCLRGRLCDAVFAGQWHPMTNNGRPHKSDTARCPLRPLVTPLPVLCVFIVLAGRERSGLLCREGVGHAPLSARAVVDGVLTSAGPPIELYLRPSFHVRTRILLPELI